MYVCMYDECTVGREVRLISSTTAKRVVPKSEPLLVFQVGLYSGSMRGLFFSSSCIHQGSFRSRRLPLLLPRSFTST